jgi:hypothetical protein
MALNCLHDEWPARQLLGEDLPRQLFTGAAVRDPKSGHCPCGNIAIPEPSTDQAQLELAVLPVLQSGFSLLLWIG